MHPIHPNYHFTKKVIIVEQLKSKIGRLHHIKMKIYNNGKTDKVNKQNNKNQLTITTTAIMRHVLINDK